MEASKNTGTSEVGISGVCNKRYNYSNNFIWRFKDNWFELKFKPHALKGKKTGRTTKKTEEGKKRISISKYKSVNQYSRDGEFIKSLLNIQEASEQTKVGNSHIGMCCSGKVKTAGKFIWKFNK